MTHRLDLMRFSLRTLTALLASLFVVVLGVSGVVATQAATAAAASHCGAGATAVGRQRDDHRSAAVQLRQRRPDLWPGRRVLRLLQRDQRRPPLQRELLLRRQRELERIDRLRSRCPRIGSPSATSPNGTSLGNTTHQDTLYIPVPLFANPPPTQCTATATCIDHPPTIDLSRIAGALPGDPSPSSVDNVPIPAHDHVVGTRNGGLPEWWNVEVVATTDPATFSTLTSIAAITAAVNASKADRGPHQRLLFFQVLPGTVPAAMAADLTATAPPGAPVATAPTPTRRSTRPSRATVSTT